MKNIDADQFLNLTIKELDNFIQFQANHLSFTKKTFEEWFSAFAEFCGIKDDSDDDEYFLDNEYEDDLCYGQDYRFEDLVNRRKYRSFRDDERY